MAQAVVGMKSATFEFLDKHGLFADLILHKAEHQKLTGNSAQVPLAHICLDIAEPQRPTVRGKAEIEISDEEG